MVFWNLGGWGNTTSCLQTVTDGLKSDQVAGTVKAMRLKHNRAYAIKVVVSGNNIKCYLDDELYIDYDVKPVKDLYQSVVRDEKGDLIIKIVNMAEEEKTVAIDLSLLQGDTFSNVTEVTVLTGPSLDAVNNFAEPEKIVPVSREGDLAEFSAFNLEPFSLTVIRIAR
jgi:alpha-L-arabinofuranosidase